MAGALLRSGKSSSLRALGKTGQPVYRAAHQIRSALQRKYPIAALNLAIPQSDQQGDNIDWYSPVEGDVIPWTAATEEERKVGRDTLGDLELELTNIRKSILASIANSPQSSSDRQAFTELLEHVIRIPDESYVYIVRTPEEHIWVSRSDGREVYRTNSVAVLTFWGFVHPDDDLSNEPLYCLNPSPEAADTAPVGGALLAAAPVAVSAVSQHGVVFDAAPAASTVVTPESRRPWWRRLWWLLPLLLLMLLLFLLRGCVPSIGLPAWSGFPSLSGFPWFGKPDTNVTVPTFPDLSVPTGGIPRIVGFENGVGINPNTVSLAPSAPASMQIPAGTAGVPQTNVSGSSAQQAQENMTVEPLSIPNEDPAAAEPSALSGEAPSGVEPPAIPSEAPLSASSEGLQIPTDAAANGPADFLNGNWQAGAGIQDKKTGKPLRLQYQFNNGQGEVTVQRPDGVHCTGPVVAAMQNGSLSINNQGQASCEDGGSYDMPAISCRNGNGTVADCSGSYSDDQFPMSMRNAEK